MKPKQILLALPLLCLAVIANAQQTIFSAGVNSGLFKFTGTGAFSMSGLSTYPIIQTQSGGRPGTESGFSYEFAATIQRITKSRWLFGAEAAYQSLQTKTTITGMTPTIYSSMYIPAEGHAKLTTQFICITPFAGYRLLNKKIKLDAITGLEMAACISKKEILDARNTSTGEKYTADNSLSRRPDYRVRLQLNASLGKIGLTTGYALGFQNYYPEQPFDPAAYSRFLRFGVTYRIR